MNTHKHHLKHLKVCPWFCLKIDYHPQFLTLTDKWKTKWSLMWIDALQLCMFLRLRLHFAGIMDLAGLTYSVANHVGCDNYATTFTNKWMGLCLIVTVIKC